jgi:DNA invertase Pin-like site-specific DNA recombinase
MRVSTKRQDTASQEPELKRWADAQEGEVRWYTDSFTGTSMDRPGFKKLLKDIETGLVGNLVVWRLDRLGRTAKGLTGLFDDLIRWRVNLISLKDGLDLSTPAGRLMANILAGVPPTRPRYEPSASSPVSKRPGLAASAGGGRRRGGG